MRSLLILITIYAVTLVSCSRSGDKQDDPATNPFVNSSCQKNAVVNGSLYNTTVTTNYGITSAVITGDCLEIKFASSGCSGDTWVVELVDANVVLDSNPVQRKLRMKLTNIEVCAAVPSKTVTFDLTPLRVAGEHSVWLSLEGFNGSLIYNY
jgi:hypothetical protein